MTSVYHLAPFDIPANQRVVLFSFHPRINLIFLFAAGKVEFVMDLIIYLFLKKWNRLYTSRSSKRNLNSAATRRDFMRPLCPG